MKHLKSRNEIIKQRINIIIQGVNTPMGKLFDIILLFIILLSVLLVMLESVTSYDEEYHNLLVICEWVITVFFTIEYILRIYSSRKPWQYITSFYGIIDLIAILPMYISFFYVGSKVLTVVRALRLLRLFRVLNLAQFTGSASQLKLAVTASRAKVLVFVYFIIIISVLLGAVMYTIEGEEAGFTSIPTSIYWCIVTLTTVGYGDITPLTPLGKMLASFIMILGYGIIAVPTGIVTAEMANLPKNKLNHEKCPNCGTSDHRVTAKYCFKCGETLEFD